MKENLSDVTPDVRPLFEPGRRASTAQSLGQFEREVLSELRQRHTLETLAVNMGCSLNTLKKAQRGEPVSGSMHKHLTREIRTFYVEHAAKRAAVG